MTQTDYLIVASVLRMSFNEVKNCQPQYDTLKILLYNMCK
jgi:hypothetical protein